jgi:glutamine cyclotransferase
MKTILSKFQTLKTQRAAFAARHFTTSSSLSSSLTSSPSSHPSSSLPSSSPQMLVDFSAHPLRDEAQIASLGTKCALSVNKDQLRASARASRMTRSSTKFFARTVSIFAIAMTLHACASSTKFTPQSLAWKVVATHPHATDMFTEGLTMVDGVLYESAGRYGNSRVCRMASVRGDGRKCVELAREFFGEGVTVLGDRVLQLTWREGVGFVYDRSLKAIDSFKYRGEGWGLTSDGSRLFLSDGTSELHVYEPTTFKVTGRLVVRDSGSAVPFLNELEYARDLIWANVWHSDGIVAIDPASGQVVGRLYLGDLRKQFQMPATRDQSENVLNGIAYDARSDRFFVTGKRWPVMFELEVEPLSAPLPKAVRH